MRKINLHCFLVALLSILGMTGVQAAEVDTTIVINENFDAFTEGSEDSPATTDISTYSSGKLSSTLPGWRGSKVYEAGGRLMVADGGYLQTPNTDMTSNGGNVRVTFKVRSLANYGGVVKVSFGYSTVENLLLEDSEWHTMTVFFENGRTTSFVKFEPLLIINGLLIDDVVVETSESFLKAPTAKQPTTADGTSFLAVWSKISGATGYLLDVYTKNGDTMDFLLQDEEVTDYYKTVTGLNENDTYYYRVRAKKNEIVSGYSNEIEVVKVIKEVSAPVATDATDVEASGFTANWEAVVDAYKYHVNLYRTETVTDDITVKVIDEDFSKVKDGSIDAIDYPATTAGYMDEYTKQPGWWGYMHCLASGYMGIYPVSEAGSITTPSLDLSHDGGKFTMTINMSAYNFGMDCAGDTVMVYVFDNETAVDSMKITLGSNFADYNFTSEKGTSNTYIKIAFINGYHKLFIDYLTVEQTLHNGDSLTTLVETKEVEEGTSCRFEAPFSEGVSYSYNVIAYVRTVVDGEIDLLGSPESNMIDVTYNVTGIHEMMDRSGVKVQSKSGIIAVQLETAQPIAIYNVNGQLLATVKGRKGSNAITVPAGMIIVKIGNETFKVVNR